MSTKAPTLQCRCCRARTCATLVLRYIHQISYTNNFKFFGRYRNWTANPYTEICTFFYVSPWTRPCDALEEADDEDHRGAEGGADEHVGVGQQHNVGQSLGETGRRQ